ncbi:MAG: phenylacetate-CoA oxygenase subunit PaaC [Hyphomicrobiaceae bacterium]|nr:MAG: phenylacetate-CoA oxygenase subunit PaaC [Hyphomicrobiaceae bacterium]
MSSTTAALQSRRAPARKAKAGGRTSRPAAGKADAASSPLFSYVVSLADDALVLGHRLSEWTGYAPTLEEDIALPNLALDLIGQARFFYAYAGEIEGKGRDEDALAYLRDEHGFSNVLLAEQPNGDFAATMLRQLLYAAFMHPYFQALTASKDARLAEIAAKAVKEMAYHVRHSAEWVIRLGDGTEESRRRAAAALDELWMYTGELFEMGEGERALVGAGVAVDRESIRPAWDATINRVLAEATLERPAPCGMQSGGRAGRHTEYLGRMLAEMQVLHRAHPGVTW